MTPDAVSNKSEYPHKDLGLVGFLCQQGKHEACPGDGYYSDSPIVGKNVVHTNCVCECHKESESE